MTMTENDTIQNEGWLIQVTNIFQDRQWYSPEVALKAKAHAWIAHFNCLSIGYDGQLDPLCLRPIAL